MKEQSNNFKDLLELFLVFFKIGAITFGGGLAMLPFLESELSVKRKWATREDLLNYYAISQVTPGIIAVNVSTFIGYKRHKIVGGIIGTLGVITPSIVIITLIAMFLSNFSENQIAQKAFAGINIAVAALLTKVSWTFAKGAFKKWYHAIIAIIVFIIIFICKVHTAWIILSTFALGIIIHTVKNAISKEGKE